MIPGALERHREALMDAIRERVCAVCLDRRDEGACRLASGRVCALKSSLPEIVDVVRSVHSDRMDEYFDAREERICSRCSSRDALGACRLRNRGECGLWTYFPLVVAAVEE